MGTVITVIVLMGIVYFLAKQYKAQPVLLFSGFILLFCAAAFVVTGTFPTEALSKSTGSIWLDIFDVFRNKASSNLAGLGLILMSIAGFARYMEHVGASPALFSVFQKPLERVKSPYLLLVVAFFVTQILVIFIPSHAGLGVLLMVTMYPILIRTGISRLSAVGVIATCQFIDHGSGSGNVIFAAKTASLDPAIYFVQHQLPVTIPIILAVALAHYLSQKWWDKRDGYVFTGKPETGVVLKEDTTRPPKVYALLPIIPLILIIGFSPIIQHQVKMDVVTAMLVSTLIAMVFELVRLKSLRAVMDSLGLFFDGMGKQFIMVVSLIICSQVFASGLIAIGFVDTLISAAKDAGFGVVAMTIAMSIILAVSAFFMGSGNAAFFSFAPLTPKIAESLGVQIVTVLLPMQVMTSFGRVVSPITPAIIAIAGMADVSPLQVVKRTAFPMLVAVLLNLGLMIYHLQGL